MNPPLGSESVRGNAASVERGAAGQRGVRDGCLDRPGLRGPSQGLLSDCRRRLCHHHQVGLPRQGRRCTVCVSLFSSFRDLSFFIPPIQWRSKVLNQA